MQCSIRTIVYIYLFGGVTFLPLLAFAFLAFIFYTSPKVTSVTPVPPIENEKEKGRPDTSSIEDLKDEDELEGVDAHKVGWLQVSREYDSRIGIIGPDKIPGNHRAKYMDKMRSLLDRQETVGPNRGEFLKVKAAMFYAVLKHGNLFLYETEEQVDVKHVIVLQHFIISLWPRNNDDDTLFLKPNAICLTRKDAENGSFDPKNDLAQSTSTDPPPKLKPPEHSYFLFPTTNIEKEDWYFALLRGAKTTTGSTKNLNPTDPTFAAVPARFDPSQMFSLIQTIHSNDAQLQTRWLNALIGRIFLGVHQSRYAEEFFTKKITKKIARVRKPAFLSDIKVIKVVVGTHAPVFTQPRLKELSAAGDFAADVNVSYNGGFRVEIATVATLQLGNRFKPRQVSLSMAVTVKKVEGKLLVRIKKPPSNRVWVGFYETPQMDLTIEPIVSSRHITYTMVLKAIENRIREALEESVVLPNMDDIAFLPTKGEFYRGGIWERTDESPPTTLSSDPATRGDVEAVEKAMEEAAEDELAPLTKETAEQSEASDVVDPLEIKSPRLKSSLRSPNKETSLPNSDQVLKKRVSRSQSFTSVTSAPAVVGTDLVNVAGTSPSRDNADWSAEAAARVIAQRARVEVSPNLTTSAGAEEVHATSLRSDSSPDLIGNSPPRDMEIPPLSLNDRSASAPPDHVTEDNSGSKSTKSIRRFPTFATDKDATISSRVGQATEIARDMLRTRVNNYLARRQQSKLEKQILTKERDLLVNSLKPRTRMPSDPTIDPDGSKTREDDDIDSGPLPFENPKSPRFSSEPDFHHAPAGYGPSVTMAIPSTMANARPSSDSDSNNPAPSSSSLPSTSSAPSLSSPTRKPVPQPPPPPFAPPRSAPRPIPRRAVPKALPTSHSPLSSAVATPNSNEESLPPPASAPPQDEDDLIILHIPSDDDSEEEFESKEPSIKESEGSTNASPLRETQSESPKSEEDEAVREPSSYGSNRSRGGSVVGNETAQQWNEKENSERRVIPELMMEQGLMG